MLGGFLWIWALKSTLPTPFLSREASGLGGVPSECRLCRGLGCGASPSDLSACPAMLSVWGRAQCSRQTLLQGESPNGVSSTFSFEEMGSCLGLHRDQIPNPESPSRCHGCPRPYMGCALQSAIFSNPTINPVSGPLLSISHGSDPLNSLEQKPGLSGGNILVASSRKTLA